MRSGKSAWFMVVLFTVFKGCSSLNTTQETTAEETFPLTTLPVETTVTDVTLPSTATASNETLSMATQYNTTSGNQTHLEIIEIFRGEDSNLTTTPSPEEIIVNTNTDCLNISSSTSLVNLTCVEQSWNDTVKTNYTTVAEAVGASEGFPEKLQNTAAIAAGIFLVSAVIGYFSCVGYRRFLQRKYGNSQILAGEEIYDTTDLRYFEI